MSKRVFTSVETVGRSEISVAENIDGKFIFEIVDHDFREALMAHLTREQAAYLALYIQQSNREAGYELPPPPEE